LGGIQGDGIQYFSWIHEDDFTAAMQFLLQNESLQGIFNLSAPHPVTNEVFMRTLRKKLKVPFGIPTPKFLLEIGARMIRTETELILKSRRVVPRKLRAAGFAFQYSQLDDGLGDLI
jgi:NAD dependent epimerase/dehydratase family enzyme